MARKTKEELNKIDEKVAVKKSTTKKVDTKKTATNKVSTAKATAKKASTSKTSTTKTTAKKASTSKASTAKATTKKASTSKTSVAKATTKKATTRKTSTTKSTTKKVATKKATKKKSTTKKSETKSKVISINPVEYYDLPYRYNETVVKVLAQNPNTLFAYWDVSDKDKENLDKQYGKLFFYNTRPVLVVHNLTDNYTFEVDIDDFANNWYINVSNTKCKYFIELGRRPKYENNNAIPVNYVNVAFSNTIEMPNDHILFFKDNDRIYFKNIKTNKITEKIFKSKTHSSKLKGIYSNYNLSETNDRFDFKNPSSQNPTSNVF